MNSKEIILAAALVMLSFFYSYGQVSPADSSNVESSHKAHQDLVTASQNPIASLISIPFQFNFFLGNGEYDRTQYVLNVEPVIPAKISENWNMINRIIIPIQIQPDLNSETGQTFGVGAINYTAFFSPKPIGKTSYGFGPSLIIPTTTSPELGNGRFAVGPSVVMFSSIGKWTLGFVAAQNWGYYKASSEEIPQNSFFTQYFINYNLPKGWTIGTGPTITVNWNAEKDQKAVVPFGLSVSHVHMFRNQGIKGSLAYYYNAVRPDLGAKGGQIQFTLSFLFPE